MCVVEVQIQKIQIDGLKLTNKLDLKKNMPNLRSVDKGTFLLLREGVTSPMRDNYMVKFYS